MYLVFQSQSLHAAVKVMFNSSSYTGAETDGIIPVTVVATGTASIPYTVIITPSESDPQSATAEVDFSNKTIEVTFNPRETEKTINVVINPDCLREGSEFFNLSLLLSINATNLRVYLGDPSEAGAEIEDTDSKFLYSFLCTVCVCCQHYFVTFNRIINSWICIKVIFHTLFKNF